MVYIKKIGSRDTEPKIWFIQSPMQSNPEISKFSYLD